MKTALGSARTIHARRVFMGSAMPHRTNYPNLQHLYFTRVGDPCTTCCRRARIQQAELVPLSAGIAAASGAFGWKVCLIGYGSFVFWSATL